MYLPFLSPANPFCALNYHPALYQWPQYNLVLGYSGFFFFPKDIEQKIQRSFEEAVSWGLSCVDHRSGCLVDERDFASPEHWIPSSGGGCVSLSNVVLVSVQGTGLRGGSLFPQSLGSANLSDVARSWEGFPTGVTSGTFWWLWPAHFWGAGAFATWLISVLPGTVQCWS